RRRLIIPVVVVAGIAAVVIGVERDGLARDGGRGDGRGVVVRVTVGPLLGDEDGVRGPVGDLRRTERGGIDPRVAGVLDGGRDFPVGVLGVVVLVVVAVEPAHELLVGGVTAVPRRRPAARRVHRAGEDRRAGIRVLVVVRQVAR